jgi:hypothetical protein
VTRGQLQLLAAIEALVDERVDAKLVALGVLSDEHSSAHPPQNVTTRTFNRWCRTGRVAGAERDGSGWRCSPQAWRESRSGGPSGKPTLRVVPNDDAAEMLRAAGMRPTRAK